MHSPSRLQAAFDFIDGAAVDGGTGVVTIRLGNMDMLTIKGGGPGIHSWPAAAPFQQYEVLMDHEPPRFWTKYSDTNGMLFARVPKLLVAHHVTRHGGIVEMLCDREVRKQMGFWKVEMLLPDEQMEAVLAMVARVKGVRTTLQGHVLS